MCSNTSLLYVKVSVACTNKSCLNGYVLNASHGKRAPQHFEFQFLVSLSNKFQVVHDKCKYPISTDASVMGPRTDFPG